MFLHKSFNKSGGVERVHKNLALAFKEVGVSALFYVMNGYGKSEEGFDELKMQFDAYRCEKNKDFLQNVRDISKLIKYHKIELVISATEKANVASFVTKLLMRSSAKHIYTRHVDFNASGQRLPPVAIKSLYNLYALNGQIVCVSESLKKQIQKQVISRKKHVHFIPNAVVGRLLFQKAKQTEHQVLHDANQAYFIAVGRLVEQKGFDLLIDAYSLALADDHTLPKLVILGEGQCEDALTKQILTLNLAHHVVLAGYVSNPYPMIQRATCMLLSSRHEGMPTVLIEALALDTPVISFNCPTGPAEIIEHKKNGVLVSHLDVQALSQALLDYKNVPSDKLSYSVTRFADSHAATQYAGLAGIQTHG